MDDEPRAGEEEWRQAASQGPLVSDPMSVLCLKAEYVGNANENFMSGIDSLNKRYDAMRRVRGDGNCFFRGFIFALCEQLLSSNSNTNGASSSNNNNSTNATIAKLRARIEEKIRASKCELVAVGYSEIAIDAFWETFVDYLAAMETRSLPELYPSFAKPMWMCLLQDFQTEGGESEYLVRLAQLSAQQAVVCVGVLTVWYARLLTAGHLKKNADKFQPFIEGLFPGQTVAQFCAAEVEPMGKECDQPQIAALTEALDIGVKIEYLDGSAKELQTYVCSPNDSSTTMAASSPSSSPRTGTTTASSSINSEAQEPVMLHLLYRPGHYDILYPRASGSAPSPTAASGSSTQA